MSVQVRRRRETAAFLSTFVGAQGELLVDTTNNRVQVHDGTTAGGFPAAGIGDLTGRNAVINGTFAINQRVYTSGTALAAGTYAHDRWKAGGGGGTYTFTQTVPDTTITITAGTLIQAVDAPNVTTTSFWLTWKGTAQARIWQSSPSGSYSLGTAATVGGVGVNALLVSGLTIGTIANIEFSTGMLGLVQFEAALPNAAPTRFERRYIGAELLLCQRYFEKSYDQATAPGATGSSQPGRAAVFALGLPSATYTGGLAVVFKTTKRTTGPTVTFYSYITGVAGKVRDASNNTDVTANIDSAGDDGFIWYATTAAATTGYNFQGQWTASAEI